MEVQLSETLTLVYARTETAINVNAHEMGVMEHNFFQQRVQCQAPRRSLCEERWTSPPFLTQAMATHAIASVWD